MKRLSPVVVCGCGCKVLAVMVARSGAVPSHSLRV